MEQVPLVFYVASVAHADLLFIFSFFKDFFFNVFSPLAL